MKHTFWSAVCLLGCAVAPAQADVLTFEDLSTAQSFFTSNYRGFKFGTNNVFDNPWFHTRIPSDFYKPRSGVRYVATDYQLYDASPFQATAPISSAVDFTFQGAWFSGARQVRFELYRDGVKVHTSADSAQLDVTPIFVGSGYDGLIDSVVVLGTQGYYAMDDFTFNAAPVPEPAQGALMLGGLLGFALLMRRGRQA